MPRLNKKGYSKSSTFKNKMATSMREWKAGKLRSGSKKGPVVTSRRQAVAISLSKARKAVTGKGTKRRKRR